MAIGPKQTNASVDLEKMKTVEEFIDSKLADSKWTTNWRCGSPGDYHYRIVCHGVLNQREIVHLVDLYMEAGWSHVEVKNSGDNGEPPGLFGITLWTSESL